MTISIQYFAALKNNIKFRNTMHKETSLAIVAIIAAVGLLGIVVESVNILQQQQAQAAQPPGRGCEFTPGGNASKLRCVRP